MGTTRARLAEVLLSPRFFWAVVAAALILRICWAAAAGDEQRFYDSDSYVKIAESLREGKGFLWGDQRAGRPPLYPLLVAATDFTALGRRFLALYLVQAVLSTATILFFAGAARRLLGPIASSVTACALALDPFLVFHVGTVLSETLFTFFLAGFFYSAVVLVKRPGAVAAVAAGLLAGGSFLTRPSLLWLVVAFAAIIVLWARPRGAALAAAACVLAVSFLVVLPWGVRNRRVTGHWVFTTLGVGASLYDGLGPQANGSSDMSFLHSMGELDAMDEYERDEHLKARALEAARQEPARVAKLAVVKAARFWSPVPNSPRFRGPAYVAASLMAVAPVYALAVLAVISGAADRRSLTMLAAGPVYFTVVHSVFVGSARYRTPVMPFVVMIAAAWVSAFAAKGLGAAPAEKSPSVQ